MTYLRFGMSLEEALTTAMKDLSHLVDKYSERSNAMNIVAMDALGNVNAASTGEGAGYVVQTIEMDEYEERTRMAALD
ncbi:MAG: hypothetical protein M9890_03985 [Thermomicrobiales bacterium]|nr:hypothetical protein [Thermomicrobiales bacterium]